VESALVDEDLIVLHAVHQTMFLIYSPRPQAFEIVLESLGCTDSFGAVAEAVQ
jgi:hypothetical protein